MNGEKMNSGSLSALAKNDLSVASSPVHRMKSALLGWYMFPLCMTETRFQEIIYTE